MAANDTLKKVLRLKLKLKESSEMKTVMKALKKLQELDVTLDILAETGIGKTVNSLRKHGDAGEVAKTLVNQWKKLVPKEPTSNNQDNHGCGKEKTENEKISKEAVKVLHEIGGVPFDILEPVLERCTPEQLLRIEGCNPVYMGVTDHLWERHCQREFRNEKLEEYESWREMYLRLSEERERKLKRLTKSIVSAHSGKPKGRQVKLAYIHSVAKPPRNVRIQQEIHGTAGPLPLPHATDKLSSIRPSFGDSSRSSSAGPGPGSSQSQDPRKIKRVAPMMAKSLKAFKKQLCRR
nr:elongin-A-like isoform X6 [Paramormyrops kingsleyae]